MSSLVADFYVQCTIPGRGEVFDAFGDRKSGRLSESYTIWGKKRAGVFARNFSLTRYDEVGGKEF